MLLLSHSELHIWLPYVYIPIDRHGLYPAFEKAGISPEFVLKLKTEQGKNLWYESKVAGGDTSSYINDVMRAWRLVMEEYDPEDIENTGCFISLQNRYALVISSINSLLDSIPPEFLLAMVESGIWSKWDGLLYARRISDRIERMRLLIGLSLLLKEPKILDEALSTAREIKDKYLRAQTLAEIAPKLQYDQKRKVSDEALSTAREIKDEYLRAQTLAEIAPKLQNDQKRKVLDEALSTAREIKDEFLRAQALGVIAPKLEDAHEALELALEIQDRYVHAYALAVIAPKLQDTYEAMKRVQEIKDEFLRAQALAEIAPKLQESQKRVVMDEALNLVREIPDREWRDEALAEIASKLQDGHEALAWVGEIQDIGLHDYALAENAPKLQDAEEAFEAACGIHYTGLFDQALAVIAPKFQDADEALILARIIHDRWLHAKALAAIAPKLQEAQKREVLEEELTLVREIQDSAWRDQALAEIVPKLQDADKALALAREFQNKCLCVQALVEIASRLPGAQKKEVLDEATAFTREILDEWEHDQALDEIKRCERSLAQTVRNFRGTDKELAKALEILDKDSRAKALKEIVSSLLARNNLSYISLWKPTIRSLSIRRRDDLLIDLSSLSPLVARLGGDEALMETIQAIKDVGRWWP